LMHSNNKKEKQLHELTVKLNDLDADSKLHSSEASPQMRQIRVLENRLDKVMIKFNEAMSIRKTYEAIEKRLRQDRVGFDSQLQQLERTLKAKEREYEELLLLSHNAYHAKEMSQAELHRFEQGVMEERNQRDKEVREKKLLVQQRVEMNNRLENRERMLRKQAESVKAETSQLKDLAATATLTAGVQGDFAQEERQKLQEYEEAFDRIKDATGVSDVNEVIQKFLTQDDTYQSLLQLTKENGKQIDKLTEDRRKVRGSVEELKFATGGQGGRRQAIESKEVDLGTSAERFERARDKYERTRKNLINMKAGIAHLGERLMPIKLDQGAEDEKGHIEINDDNIEEVLRCCELKLSRLMSIVHRLDDPANRDRAIPQSDDRYEEKLLNRSQADVRISLNEGDHDADDDGDDFDDDDDRAVDCFRRRDVKNMCEQILEKQQTKGRKKGKKKKDA